MRRTILTTTILLLAFTSAWAGTEAFEVDGIPVILRTNAETPVVSATFVLKGGLPYYGTDQAGIGIAPQIC